MATVFIVDNTSGTLSITLRPGALNGPGGTVATTDLRLYGMGALLWGEGVNENLLRLTENFACEEKSGSPGVPQDASDLGAGLGINNPVEGQIWYNKTNSKLYVYDGSSWIQSSSSDIGDISGLNTRLDGIDANVASKVSKSGDTMSGELNMGTNKITNLATPTANTDAATKAYVDTSITGPSGSLSVHVADATVHLTSWQNGFLDTLEAGGSLFATVANNVLNIQTDLNTKVNKAGDIMSGALNMGNNKVTNLGTPTLATDAATKSYADSNFYGASTSAASRKVYISTASPSGGNNGDIWLQY